MNKIKKIYCIEFIGLWGSGKTTIINKIYKDLKLLNYKIVKFSDFYKYSKTLRLLLIIKFILFNPIFILKWFFLNGKFYFKLKPKNNLDYEIFITLIKNQLIRNILLKELNPDFLLWEGTFHLLPIFKEMNKINSSDIIDYNKSNMINVNTCIVFLDIDPNKSKNRILNDNKRSFKRFNSDQLKLLNKNLNIMNTNQYYLLKKIKKKIKYLISINTNKNKNSNINKIKNFLLKID